MSNFFDPFASGNGGGGGGSIADNYETLFNKPTINGETLLGNKTSEDLHLQGTLTFDDTPTKNSNNPVKSGGIWTALNSKANSTDIPTKTSDLQNDNNFIADANYVHTDNNFSDALKDKLENVDENGEANVQSDWNQVDDTADDYIKNKPTIPTVNDSTITIKKNNVTVDSFTTNAVAGKIINIEVPTSAEDVSALPNSTKYGASFVATVNTETYVMTFTLKDQNGDTLGTQQTIDLPIESVVVNGSYDDSTKKVVLTLKNGSTIEFSIADLVAGLQTELSASNKLNPSYINYDSTHAAVTEAEKNAWDAKSDFSGSYNDLSDKPTIPSALSDLTEDTTHRVVTDTEKTTWNGKQDAISVSGGISKSGNTISHSNTVTSETTQTFMQIAFDGNGHITNHTNATQGQLDAINSGVNSTVVAQVATNTATIGDISTILASVVEVS